MEVPLKKNMKNFTIIFLFLVYLVSCAPSTTSVLYLSTKKADIKNVGVVSVNLRNSEIDSLFPWIYASYDSIAINTWKKQFISNAIFLPNKIEYLSPDRNEIREICSKNGLDGVLVSKIDFLKVITTVYGIPVSKFYDHVLESKVFDKEGVLIYTVSNSTENRKKANHGDNEYELKISLEKNIALISQLKHLK